VQAIVGAGDFEERLTGTVDDLWSRHGEATIFESHEEYMDFIRGRAKATFIRFKNLAELNPPIPLARLLQAIGCSRLPRNGRYLSEETVKRLM
jgi:predicted transcriptional regulator